MAFLFTYTSRLSRLSDRDLEPTLRLSHLPANKVVNMSGFIAHNNNKQPKLRAIS